MVTLEVKVSGSAQYKTVEHEVIWLDWDEFEIIPASKRAGSHRQFVSNGKTAFSILRGKARAQHLIEHRVRSGRGVPRRGLAAAVPDKRCHFHLSDNPTNRALSFGWQGLHFWNPARPAYV